MGTKTGINTAPTDYQANLLLAALDNEHHRIPSNAKGRTLDLMYGRQWAKEYTADGRLASTVRNYPGSTHFRLTHHGVNAAKKARAARAAKSTAQPRVIDVEGIGWTCETPGKKWSAEYEGVRFELERRTRNVLDECPDTGWYLYGGGHFGEYMAARFMEAATEAFPLVCPKDGHPKPAAAPEALAERFPVDSAAVYVPEESEAYRDIVIVKSGPAGDGKVDAISARYNGKNIRVALAMLEPLPESAPVPAGEITDWWTITDAEGAEVTRVQAEDDPGAREAAMREASVRTACRRDKGLAVRRLRSSELAVPVGELRGLPRTAK